MALQNDVSQAVKGAQAAAAGFEQKQVSSVKANWKWLVGGLVLGLVLAFVVHKVF